MPRIKLVTEINATPERCFDLARDLDLHVESLGHTGERAVAGKTSGLIGMGEEVKWRGRHFGVVHHHTSRITAYDRPRHFRDEMIRGRFNSFCHDHYFKPTSTGTRMVDEIQFKSPLGILGVLVDRLVLTRYLKRLIEMRNEVVRIAAESGVQSSSAGQRVIET